jgi:outer membrane lipopolysaccharide assembly protein LptE/RlpB
VRCDVTSASPGLKPLSFGSRNGGLKPASTPALRAKAAMLRILATCIVVPVLVALAGCGYHQVGAATHVPAGIRTMAVPIFHSNVQAYKTETVFTQAVVRELNTRTKYRVLTATGEGTFASADADSILRGTIQSQTIAPLTYDATSGQTSSYLVTITAKVVLTAHDGRVLYENDAFRWREQYQSTQDLSGFIQEDGFAVKRMARDFAQAVVSDLLESF